MIKTVKELEVGEKFIYKNQTFFILLKKDLIEHNTEEEYITFTLRDINDGDETTLSFHPNFLVETITIERELEEFMFDWKNIDLESKYDQEQLLISPYSIKKLLNDGYHLRDLSVEGLKEMFKEGIMADIESALEIIEENGDNIVSYLRNLRGF